MKEFMASTMEIKMFSIKKRHQTRILAALCGTWEWFKLKCIQFPFLEQKKFNRYFFGRGSCSTHWMTAWDMIFNVDCNWLGRGIWSVLSIVWHAMHSFDHIFCCIQAWSAFHQNSFWQSFFFKITSLNSYMLAGVKFKLRLNNNGNNAFQLISATEK